MKRVYLLTDYKGFFSLKWEARPYRSGLDRKLLTDYLGKYGYEAIFVRMADVNFRHQDWSGKVVLYTSSEEVGDNYKRFIEDVILGLQLCGAHVLPPYEFLRAHNNKVFMEILRDQLLGPDLGGFSSRRFGTFEELETAIANNQIGFPCVIKGAAGAMSSRVRAAKNGRELVANAKILSRTPHYFHEIKDYIRTRKIEGYSNESRYQSKFVVQPLIPGLMNDWKVLIYGDQYYVLKRHVRPNDFRASGSHVDYKAGIESGIPLPMFDYLEQIFARLDVPQLSVDIGFDGERGYVFEFQAVNFGTSTQYICRHYFIKKDGCWVNAEKQFDQEEAYVWGLVKYFERHDFHFA